MNEIQMTFTPAQLDVIYMALQKGPFEQVAPVIRAIEEQVGKHNAQLSEAASNEEEEAA